MMFRQRKLQRAFTLIESLVVMMAIILLASIVIPGLMGKGNKKPKLPQLPSQKPVPTGIESPVPALPEGDLDPDPKKFEPAVPTSPVAEAE